MGRRHFAATPASCCRSCCNSSAPSLISRNLWEAELRAKPLRRQFQDICRLRYFFYKFSLKKLLEETAQIYLWDLSLQNISEPRGVSSRENLYFGNPGNLGSWRFFSRSFSCDFSEVMRRKLLLQEMKRGLPEPQPLSAFSRITILLESVSHFRLTGGATKRRH